MIVTRNSTVRVLPAAMSDRVAVTTPLLCEPPELPSALQVPPLTVPFTRMPKPATKVVVAGRVSLTLTLVAVALPEAFATAMQYSTVAPGIIRGFVVPLIGSLMIRLVLVTLRAAARTV